MERGCENSGIGREDISTWRKGCGISFAYSLQVRLGFGGGGGGGIVNPDTSQPASMSGQAGVRVTALGSVIFSFSSRISSTCPISGVFTPDHKVRHTYSVGLAWTSVGLSERPVPAQHEQTQGTKIQAYSGIRARDPSNKSAADLRYITPSV
jgi:hypothetical protein